MPVINGVQLLKTVKDLNPQVRTMLMTAFEIEDELFQEYIKKEIINRIVKKPITVETLVDDVNGQLHYYETQKKSMS